MGRSRSKSVTILLSLVDRDTVVVELFLVCHVVFQDHVTKGYSHHPSKFGGHGHCGSGDVLRLSCNAKDYVI